MSIEKLLYNKGIIHSDPEIMSGVSVFVGTHVPLQTFFDYLEAEEALAEFINDFPTSKIRRLPLTKHPLSHAFPTASIAASSAIAI